MFIRVRRRPLVGRITPFHGGNRGSNPLGDANNINVLDRANRKNIEHVRQKYGKDVSWTLMDEARETDPVRAELAIKVGPPRAIGYLPGSWWPRSARLL